MSLPLVASPCTKVCTIDPESGWCDGCLRTLDEIAAWGALTPFEQARICERLEGRRLERRAAALVDRAP